MFKNFKKGFAKALPVSMIAIMVSGLFMFFALYNPAVQSVDAAIGSITFNSGTLTLSNDADSNGIANIGDTVSVSANITNTDGNGADPNETTVIADLSAFGCGAAVAMDVTDGTEGATAEAWGPVTCVIAAGAVDVAAATQTVTITYSDADDGAAASATSALAQAFDNDAPTVTAANINGVGATGTGGAYKNGDAAGFGWDVTTEGESDTLASVTINAASFKAGDTALAAGLVGGIYQAALSGAMDAQDDTNNNISVTVTDNAGNVTTTSGTNNWTVDTNVPTVTGANVTVTGATGTGSAFKNGDTPVLTWDVTTQGEGDTIASATFNGANFAAVDTALAGALVGGLWTANLSAGMDAQDDVGNTITATVVDNAGNSSGAVTSAVGYVIDTNKPTVTAPNINGVGATGTGGAYKNGDAAGFGWDVTTEGESDTLASVTINAVSFKAGDTTLAAALVFGIYQAALSGAMDAQDDTNNNISVTVTDNAGNVTTTSGTNNWTVDTNVPAVTAARVTVTGATGTGSAFRNGDTPVLTWNVTADGEIDTIASATFNGTNFAAADAALAGTLGGGFWTANLSAGMDLQDDVGNTIDATVVDNAGNSSGAVTSAVGYVVDILVPTVTIGNLNVDNSGCTGTCIPGDHVIFTWDSSAATGDNNTDVVSVTGDITNFGGIAAQTMYDDGTNGDVTGGDQIWTYDYMVGAGTNDGMGVLWVNATDDANNVGSGGPSAAVAIDNEAPVVTDPRISISSGTGIGGAYIIGDSVVVTWNASADGNSDIASADADLSGWGGAPASAIAMTDTTACGGANADNVLEACYTIVGTEGIDGAGIDATVTATDDANNVTGPISDTTGATVDTIAPTIGTPGTVTLADTSLEGIASIGESLTYMGGTEGTGDAPSTWEINYFAFNGLPNQAPGAWVVVADNDDGAFAAQESVTDNAGNVASGGPSATLVGFTNIDNVKPIVTDGSISVFGGSGTGLAYIIGDTVTVAWDNSVATGDGNLDIASADADLSGWGGLAIAAMRDDGAGCDGTGGDNIWCAEYTITGAEGIDGAGINATVTAVDDASNSTGPVGDTTGATIDTIAPTFFTSGLSISTDNGVGGVAAVNGGLVAADGVTVNATVMDIDVPTITWDATTIGGGAAIPNGNEVTVSAGGTDAGGAAFMVTAIDDAGNVTTDGTHLIDGVTITLDNVLPTIGTPGTFTITADAGVIGTAEIADTVTYNDGTPGAVDGDTWEVDITTLTGDANATNLGSPYLVIAGTLLGNIGFTETVTDNGGNSVTGTTATLNVNNYSQLTATSVGLSDNHVSALDVFTIFFTTASIWPKDGKIRIVFPAQFDIAGLEGVTATNLTNMDGVLTASVGGMGTWVTLVRDGTGTATPAGTAVSFKMGNGTNGAVAGATGTFDFRTLTSADAIIDAKTAVAGVTLISNAVACNDGVDNDGDTLIDMADPGCTAGTDTDETDAAPSGGGGGGGGGGQTSNTSNTTTSSLTSTVSTTVNGDTTYSRTVAFNDEMITVDTDNNTSTVDVTGTGTLTIKPNSASTISLVIPESTTVTSTADWNGEIAPPLIKSLTMISTAGDAIEGSDTTLPRSEVAVVVKVGANTPLTFDNPVTINIPVDLPDGTVIKVYTSNDGDTWTSEGTAVVQNGVAVYTTTHLTYFALQTTEEILAEVQAAEGVSFTDIVGHWAETYINAIADIGIVSGKTETTFAPNDAITRAELTKIAVKAFNYSVDPVVNSTTFGDVSTSAWYAPYIVAARDAGIVQGYEDGTFSPNGLVNRAEALKILIEAAGFTGVTENYDANYAGKEGYTYVGFPDVLIGEWFAKYVAYAKDNSIIGGYADGTFGPGNSITRAEVAKIVSLILEMK